MNPLLSTSVDLAWHSFRRFISVLVWVLVFAGLGWAIYAGIIRPTTKPTPTTTQNAREITNNYFYPNKKVFSLGLNLWGMDLGIVKYVYPQTPIVKETITK